MTLPVSFEFTIGEDVIPYFLGKQCFPEIVEEILKIGQGRKFDKLFIGCDENIRFAPSLCFFEA